MRPTTPRDQHGARARRRQEATGSPVTRRRVGGQPDVGARAVVVVVVANALTAGLGGASDKSPMLSGGISTVCLSCRGRPWLARRKGCSKSTYDRGFANALTP